MSDSSVQLEIRTMNADDDGKSPSTPAPPVVIVQKGTALPPALRSMDVITVETSADSVRVRQPNDRNGRSLRTGEPLRMTGVELLLLRPPTSTAAPAALAPVAAPARVAPQPQPAATSVATTSSNASATAVAARPAPARTFTPTPYVQSIAPPATPALAGAKPALRLMLPSGVVVFYELPTNEGAEVIVGRSPKTSSICIDDRAVQPKHLRLTRFGSGFRAVDLSEGSKTKLNLDALVWPADLVDGDELTIGGVTLRYVARCTASTMIPVRNVGSHAVTHAGKSAPSPSASPWGGSSSSASPNELAAFAPAPRAFTPAAADAPATDSAPAARATTSAPAFTPSPTPAGPASSSSTAGPSSGPSLNSAAGLASGLASWTPVAAPATPTPSPWASAQPATPGPGPADQRELGPLAYLSLQTLLVSVGIGVVGLLGIVMGLAALMMNK